MYNRIKGHLVSPRMIATFIDEKKSYTFITLLILLILYIIPSLVIVLTANTLPVETANNFSDSAINTQINYQIVDNELKKTKDTASDEFLKGNIVINDLMIDAVCIYSYYNNIDNFYDQMNSGANLVLLFSKDHLELYTVNKNSRGTYTSIEIADIKYNKTNLNNIDLSSTNKQVLNQAYNKIIDELVWQFWKAFKGVAVIIVIIAVTISYFLNILLVSVMAMLFRLFKLKFRTLFKITIYCSAPYVLLNMISRFSGWSVFSMVGIVLLVLFVYLCSGTYQFLNMKKEQEMEGENNEL